MKSLIILLSLFSLQAMAVEGAGTTSEEPTYRYPSDLSEEEHTHMIMSRDKYDTCLNKEAKENLDKHEDVRKVADVAMENCKPTLAEIDGDLEKMNLDPDFRRYFMRKASQKSAQKLLPELMMMKSK